MSQPAVPGEVIPIASDHGGFDLKELLLDHLAERGYQPLDLGCPDRTSVDYPEYGIKLARAVAAGAHARGILICGTGIGMSITANRVAGVRAALCHDAFTARMSREHNDANLLVLGARVLGVEVALDMVDTWLSTAFGGDRHQRRLNLIETLSAE